MNKMNLVTSGKLNFSIIYISCDVIIFGELIVRFSEENKIINELHTGRNYLIYAGLIK